MLGTTHSNFMLCIPIFDHELGAKKSRPCLSDLLALPYRGKPRSQNSPIDRIFFFFHLAFRDFTWLLSFTYSTDDQFSAHLSKY